MARTPLAARVRWANVAKLAAALAVGAGVLAWPRLQPPPAAVPEGAPRPVVPRAAAVPRLARPRPERVSAEGPPRRGERRRREGGAARERERPRHEGRSGEPPTRRDIDPQATRPRRAPDPRPVAAVERAPRPAPAAPPPAPPPEPVAAPAPAPSAPATAAAEFGVE